VIGWTAEPGVKCIASPSQIWCKHAHRRHDRCALQYDFGTSRWQLSNKLGTPSPNQMLAS
jgi:hypothetical protein